MKRLLAKRWVRIYALIVTVGLLLALVVVPMVRGWGLPDWSGKPLTDSTGLLTQENHLAVNASAEGLTKQYNTDVQVAIVDSLQGKSMEDFARRLYSHWGVGRRELNGGLLIVISASEQSAYGFAGGNFGVFLPEGTRYEITDKGLHSTAMRALEAADKQLKAFRSTDMALKPSNELSIWEKLAPLWVVLGIAVIMVPIVFQERLFFFKGKDNRGGIHRPMYNVGGGSQGPVNYSARGKN